MTGKANGQCLTDVSVYINYQVSYKYNYKYSTDQNGNDGLVVAN